MRSIFGVALMALATPVVHADDIINVTLKNAATCVGILKFKTVPALIDYYVKNVESNPAEKDAKPHVFVDADPLNERKLQFIKEYSAVLSKMIREGVISMDDLRQAPVFNAEAYINGKFEPYAWVIVRPAKIYTFDLKDKNKQDEIATHHYGFLAEGIPAALRLDKKYIFTLNADNGVLLPVELKDPTLLPKIEENLEQAQLKAFLHDFRAEFEQLLLKTDFTLQDLNGAHVVTGKVRETGADIYLIVAREGAAVFYVSKTPGAFDQNKNTYGAITPDERIGFRETIMRSIELTQDRTLQYINGRLVVQRAAAEAAMSEAAGANAMMKVQHPITGEIYDVYLSRQGYMAVREDLPGGKQLLKDIDTNYPVRWQGEERSLLVIRRAAGMISTIIEEILWPVY